MPMVINIPRAPAGAPSIWVLTTRCIVITILLVTGATRLCRADKTALVMASASEKVVSRLHRKVPLTAIRQKGE
jgi:hypothetical protein